MSRRLRLHFATLNLSEPCPSCGREIHPRDIQRLGNYRCRCPHCLVVYEALPSSKWSQAHHRPPQLVR